MHVTAGAKYLRQQAIKSLKVRILLEDIGSAAIAEDWPRYRQLTRTLDDLVFSRDDEGAPAYLAADALAVGRELYLSLPHVRDVACDILAQEK